MAELSDQEMMRYNRQIILRGFDFEGQEALKEARVLVVGVGAGMRSNSVPCRRWRRAFNLARL